MLWELLLAELWVGPGNLLNLRDCHSWCSLPVHYVVCLLNTEGCVFELPRFVLTTHPVQFFRLPFGHHSVSC